MSVPDVVTFVAPRDGGGIGAGTAAPPPLSGLVEPAATTAGTGTTTLLDSFDGRLHAAGLRAVLVGSDPGELVVTGPDVVAVRTPVSGVPRTADDLPAGPLRERVGRLLGVRALVPLLAVRSRCRQVAVVDDDGKTRVGIAVHDDVELVAPAGVSLPDPLTLVEVRALRGFAADAERVRQELGEWTPVQGDLAVAVARLAGIHLGGFDSSPNATLDRDQPAFDGFRAVLADLARTMEANRPGTIGDLDIEFLHDLRVAVRRTRSILGHARHVVPADVRSWAGDALREIGAVTGPVRDLDVQLFEWHELVAPFDADVVAALEPVRGVLVERRERARGELSAALTDGAYVEFSERWRAWLDDPDATPGDRGDRPLGDVVADRFERAQRRVLRDGRAIDDESPADMLHQLRKDAKKLRYVLECFGSIVPSAPRKRFVKRLKRLQDVLGTHQDAAVHAAQLEVIARELHAAGASADTLLAVGRLVEEQHRRARTARREFASCFASYDDERTADAFARAVGKLRR